MLEDKLVTIWNGEYNRKAVFLTSLSEDVMKTIIAKLYLIPRDYDDAI